LGRKDDRRFEKGNERIRIVKGFLDVRIGFKIKNEED
jgi:hypothetical protein